MTYRPTIIILADAWGYSSFKAAREAGCLDDIERLLISDGVLISNLVSVFPSVSLSSHASLLTGASPREHQIAGHRWLEKRSGKRTNYISLQGARVDRDMSPSVSTVFERLGGTGIAVGLPVSRGADISTPINKLDSRAILRKAGRLILQHPESTTVIWLPRGDVISHTHGPLSVAMMKEMKLTSTAIGEFARKLSAVDLWERARVILVADHGQRRVSQFADLAAFCKALGYSARLNPRRAGEFDAAIYTNGDSAAYVYYRDGSIAINRKVSDCEALARNRGVGLVFLRVDESTHHVFGRNGEARITRESESEVGYSLIRGEDPLSLLKAGASNARLDSKLTEVSKGEPYPGLLPQYLDSYVEGRSSSVIVTADDGFHFGKSPRFGWRLGFHKGSHGGPKSDEMLSVAIAKGFDKRVPDAVRIQDLLPLLFGKDWIST